MDPDRLKLHALLVALLMDEDAVYFQPAANTKMRYPAIVYERDDLDIDYANNNQYRRAKRYSVTVIDRNPDSAIVDKVSRLPLCAFNRHFVVDNLNHDVFTLYF